MHLGQQLRRRVHVATVRQRRWWHREALPSSSGGTISPCAIATSTSGTGHFNGDWLQVRVAIPPDYTCDPTTPSTCEWTLRYDGTAPSLTDSTTWAAPSVL